uniref:DUF4062 domain-containing protein n=1 Tax=Biomphalaria glabrata TaxID=6526 RepID=A0A2C9K456_BIOGL
MATKLPNRPVLKKHISSLKIPVSSDVTDKSKIKPTESSIKSLNNGPKPRAPNKKTQSQSPSVTAKPTAVNSRQTTYDKEVEQKFDHILEGDFTDLLPLPRSTVRIFLSSTFSDMRAERNALAKLAYPKLRDFCTEMDLGFQVVDLRWGVTAEATNSHLTTEICLLELKNCQKVSVGPNCIAIIGNRYGFCPLPYKIFLEEYTILKSEAKELGLTDFDLIDQWYFKDDNSIPPAYYLQPITSQLPYFLDNSSQFESQKKAQIEEWNRIEKTMLATLYKTAISACNKQIISQDRKHLYLMSVTEHEARAGIVTALDPSKHGLVFLRELDNFTSDMYKDQNASRYKDLINESDKPDTDINAENLLKSFKHDLVSNLNESNVTSYNVPWQSGGINPELFPAHKEYIDQFCSDFVTKVKAMIQVDASAKESLIRQGEYYSSFEEVLHHAHFCQTKTETFCGQNETLNKIKEYILDPANRKPFVIHAQSGAGKTSVMAMAKNSLRLWIKEDHVSIIQFLGTTPLSTDIYNVLFSLCGQLADITDSIMEPQSYRTMKALAMYLPRFFRTIGSILKMPVIIFLDSLDQLDSKHDAYTAWWLPVNLPSNFKLVISTLPDHHEILTNLRNLVSLEKNFVEVPLLPDVTSREIVARYLTFKKRQVNDYQIEFLLETFKKSPSPLFLKLLMDHAVHWCSYTPLLKLTLPDSVRVAINNLFQQLEIKFGSKFVQGALGLLTVGYNGLSEIELEDGLSCMDDVLNEVYRFHDPPVPGLVRIPPVMWARLRYDIKDYLVERQSQGQTTLFWYHRQFREVATERYANSITGQKLHQVLFELFAAEDGVKRDIVLMDRNNLYIPNADRNSTPQVTSIGNNRKLECLSYHLKHCQQRIQDQDFVKQTTYCNLMFLRAKVTSVGIEKLLRELEDYQSIVQDEEVDVIMKFIVTCSSSLKDPVVAAFNILAHIPDETEHNNILLLKTKARQYLWSLNKTVLMPSFACLVPRCGEPEKTYVGFSHFLGIRNELVLFASSWPSINTEQKNYLADHSATLACIDMKTAELSKHFCENISSEPYMMADGKVLVYFSVAELTIIKLNIETGKCNKFLLVEIFPGSHGNKLSTDSCLISGSMDSKFLAICLGDGLVVVEAQDMKPICLLQQPVKTKVTNIHCSSGPPLVVIVTSDDREITYWDVVKKEIIRRIKTSARIEPKCSHLTLEDEFHISYSNFEDEHSIYVNKVKHEDLSEPLQVSKVIQMMKVSRIDQEIYILIGGTEIKVLNLDSRHYVKTFLHETGIVSFDVAWDDEKLLIADTNNSIILLNQKFDVIISHEGILGQINYVGILQGQMLIATLESKVKIWNMKDFFAAISEDEKSKSSTSSKILSHQDDVTCFVMSSDGQILLTAGTHEICRVWSLQDCSFLREFRLHLKPTRMVSVAESKFVAYDSEMKRLISFQQDGVHINCNYPDNVTCFTITKENNRLLFLTKGSKQTLFIYDIKSNIYLKKFHVNINFNYLSAKMFLSVSERYAVFKWEVTPEDFKAISAMWNKGTKLPEQKHPFRFSAVDLNQGSGVQLHVYHQLTKVPQLGIAVEPYKGNLMMVSSRRWVVFWDIPTGNCDQMMCKSPRKTKMYRPDWLGQDCVGSNDIITMSTDRRYVAVGSQDGYVFVYDGESGMPVGMKAPTSRHPSPVNQVCFNSSTSLLASSCTSGYLKVWLPKTGRCIFSVSIGMELRQLEFSHNGKKLMAVTTAELSHVLMFDITKEN